MIVARPKFPPFLLASAACAALLGCGEALPNSPNGPKPSARITVRTDPQDKGRLERLNGELVLTTQGTPYEEGFQHGYLLRDEIRSLYHDYYEGHVFKAVPLLPPFVHAWHSREFAKAYSSEEMGELQGMAAGSGLPLEQILIMQAPPVWAILASRTGEPRAARLSSSTATFFVTGKAVLGGGSLLGNNTSGFDFDQLHRYAILRVHHPSRGMSYVAPGTVGNVLEAQSGWNDRGLVVAAPDTPGGSGLPAGLVCRRLLQSCGEPGDAEKQIQHMPGANTTGVRLLVAAPHDAQLLEGARGKAGGNKKPLLTVRMLREAKHPEGVLSAGWSVQLHRALSEAAGRIDFTRALELLADTTDPGTGKKEAGYSTISLATKPLVLRLGPLVWGRLGKMTTFESSLWDLEKGQLYLAHGHEQIESPAQFVNFDLRELLRSSAGTSSSSVAATPSVSALSNPEATEPNAD